MIKELSLKVVGKYKVDRREQPSGIKGTTGERTLDGYIVISLCISMFDLA